MSLVDGVSTNVIMPICAALEVAAGGASLVSNMRIYNTANWQRHFLATHPSCRRPPASRGPLARHAPLTPDAQTPEDFIKVGEQKANTSMTWAKCYTFGTRLLDADLRCRAQVTQNQQAGTRVAPRTHVVSRVPPVPKRPLPDGYPTARPVRFLEMYG